MWFIRVLSKYFVPFTKDGVRKRVAFFHNVSAIVTYGELSVITKRRSPMVYFCISINVRLRNMKFLACYV